jgi:hypothetical protein
MVAKSLSHHGAVTSPRASDSLALGVLGVSLELLDELENCTCF